MPVKGEGVDSQRPEHEGLPETNIHRLRLRLLQIGDQAIDACLDNSYPSSVFGEIEPATFINNLKETEANIIKHTMMTRDPSLESLVVVLSEWQSKEEYAELLAQLLQTDPQRIAYRFGDGFDVGRQGYPYVFSYTQAENGLYIKRGRAIRLNSILFPDEYPHNLTLIGKKRFEREGEQYRPANVSDIPDPHLHL